MQKKNIYQRILLSCLVFGIIIWFGGSVVRSAIAFSLFDTTPTLAVKTGLGDPLMMQTVNLYAVSASYTISGYLVSLISAILLCVYWRGALKQRGWLFMSFILFFLSAPVEIYLIIKDIYLNIAIQFDHVKIFSNSEIQKYFVDRFKSIPLATSSGLSFLAVITAIIYTVWQPLDLNKACKNDRNLADNEIA